MTGQHEARAGVVISQFVRERANERDVAHDLRGQRQVLADLQTRHARGYGTKLTANFTGSVRLGIEGIEVAWSAIQPKENARGRSLGGRVASRGA